MSGEYDTIAELATITAMGWSMCDYFIAHPEQIDAFIQWINTTTTNKGFEVSREQMTQRISEVGSKFAGIFARSNSDYEALRYISSMTGVPHNLLHVFYAVPGEPVRAEEGK